MSGIFVFARDHVHGWLFASSSSMLYAYIVLYAKESVITVDMLDISLDMMMIIMKREMLNEYCNDDDD